MSGPKQEMRAQMRRVLRDLAAPERLSASERAARHLLDLPEIAEAATIALFAGAADEIDPRSVAESLWERGTAVLLPRVGGDRLDLIRVHDEETLSPGYRGILEPRGPVSDLADLDVIVVPGLAFDRAGRRLGRGGGHYDRLLADLDARTLRVGLCFAAQTVEEVPHEAHDENVDLLVTEEGAVRTGARQR
jgi:5-formyltetrahydrofolate cyclo-ligase